MYASYIDEVERRAGSGGLRYYHRNGQYSITSLTDSGGSIVERNAYMAYGKVTFTDASGTVQTASASNNRYTYTGREWDAGPSRYHFRARMYDPVAGRFASRDAIGFKGSFPMLYQFLNAAPLTGRDPAGMRIDRGTIDVLIGACFLPNISTEIRGATNLPGSFPDYQWTMQALRMALTSRVVTGVDDLGSGIILATLSAADITGPKSEQMLNEIMEAIISNQELTPEEIEGVVVDKLVNEPGEGFPAGSGMLLNQAATELVNAVRKLGPQAN